MTDPEPRSLLLAIDTSSDQAGIAVADGDRVASLVWPAGRGHTVTLLPQIHRLLDLMGVAVGDLAGIAVAVGPGTFTGLRVGLSVAKGLAFALDRPLVGVPTLEAAALPHLLPGRTVVAAVATGRGRVVWAAYERGDDGLPRPVSPPRNAGPAGLRADLGGLPGPLLVVGELPSATEGGIADRPDPQRILPALGLRQPAAILELARPRFAAGATDDPVALEPLYPERD